VDGIGNGLWGGIPALPGENDAILSNSRSLNHAQRIEHRAFRIQRKQHCYSPQIMSLAAMQGSASGSNVRYYPTWKHSPLKEKNEHGCYNCYKLPDVCIQVMSHYVFLSLINRKSSVHLLAVYSPRTALRILHPAGINSWSVDTTHCAAFFPCASCRVIRPLE
jgi:hypothetical protein